MGILGVRGVIPVAGQQPGRPVCLSSHPIFSRKTPQDMPERKNRLGKEAYEGGLTPIGNNDAASVCFIRRQACCILSDECIIDQSCAGALVYVRSVLDMV